MLLILLGWANVAVTRATGSPPEAFSIEPSFTGEYSHANPRPYFIYNDPAGTTLHDRIYVKNSGKLRGTVELYPTDATTAQTSGTMFLPQRAPRQDVGAWITISQEQVILEPGQSIEIPFTLHIPTSIRSGQHGGGIIAKDITPQHYSQSQGDMSVQIGIQGVIALGVLVNIAGPTVEKLTASGVAYDSSSRNQRVLVSLHNTGTQLLHPSGSLQIIDAHGNLKQNIPLHLNTFLPQTSIDYPVYMQHTALLPGNTYTAKLHLAYEGTHVLDYSASFAIAQPKKPPLTNIVQNLVKSPTLDPETPPIWQFAIAGSVLFLIVTALFFWGQKIYRLLLRLSHKK